jgi:hypothetical protein
MSTRIRYVKEEDCLVSKQYFRIGDKEYKVVLFENLFKFSIMDSSGLVILTDGNTKNKAVLRIQAKRALEEMGYKFEDERRSEGTDTHES